MLRRTILARCCGGAALAAAGACSRRERPPGTAQLLILAAPTLSMSSLWLTQELNYFKDAGIDARIEQPPGSSESIALLAGGKADVVFTAYGVPLLSAMLKGLPIRIVAGREIASTTCGNVGAIYAMRKRFPAGLADLRVLKGKRVAINPYIGLAHFALETHLASAGMTAEDVIQIPVRAPENVAALIGGSADALLLITEFDRNLARVLSETVHTSGIARYYPNLQYSHVFYGKRLLEGDVDLGRRFLAAYLRGAREFARGTTPEYMKKFANKRAADAGEVVAACRDTFTLNGDIDLHSLQLINDWALRRKYVTQPVEASSLVDTRFLARAHAS